MIEPPWVEPLGPEIWASPGCYISVNCRWEYQTMSATCDIPNCLALPEPDRRFCRLHALARRAVALGLSGSGAGTGAKQCLLCKQPFKSHDWVLIQTERRDPMTATGRPSKASPVGHVHVACAPVVRKVSKKKAREAPKPLFADL